MLGLVRHVVDFHVKFHSGGSKYLVDYQEGIEDLVDLKSGVQSFMAEIKMLSEVGTGHECRWHVISRATPLLEWKAFNDQTVDQR